MRAEQQDEATRTALERIAKDGSDLNRPLKMDFFVAVPDEIGGHTVAARASELGFDTSVEQDPESGDWTCICSKLLVLSNNVVVSIEVKLDSLAHDIGGYVDGFGTFGNIEFAAAR
jgi:regulator of RNase E activity RraB